jgi:hypothetical protein
MGGTISWERLINPDLTMNVTKRLRVGDFSDGTSSHSGSTEMTAGDSGLLPIGSIHLSPQSACSPMYGSGVTERIIGSAKV